MLEKAAGLPREIIAKSEKRIIAFHSLKAELDADLSKVHEQLEAVRTKFKANLHTANNYEGLLMQSEQKYLDCLEIKHRELEELLRRDAVHWDLDLEKTKSEAANLQE